MRVSVPTIPHAVTTASSKPISPAVAVERIVDFLSSGSVTLLTGAGVSVDSGIRAYRGKDGRYMNPNYQPIFYHELVDRSPKGHMFRQRYWLRSYLGYPPVRDALPNTTHCALAALQYTSHISRLITQNVDGLHRKAIAHVWHDNLINERMLELHGSLHRVHCNHGHVVDRNTFQDWISAHNPYWKDYVTGLEATGMKPRTNPDGDVELEGVSYDDFVIPECPQCVLEGRHNTNQKPTVIFFGESIPTIVRNRSFHDVERSDRLFVVGTTLATFSAFRLVQHAVKLGKPVLLLNMGATRGDGLPGVEKIEIPASYVIRDVARTILGTRATADPVIVDLLNKGIYDPPSDR
ncbi:DHS-like NAD/FAD-binding domain-containing protein [Pisolithus tinctorius]|nr:DHS-like NAD/FAD-binding domain-containing protein [Pisolithus tinctorius]